MKMHDRSLLTGRALPQQLRSSSAGSNHCRHQLSHSNHPPSLEQTRQPQPPALGSISVSCWDKCSPDPSLTSLVLCQRRLCKSTNGTSLARTVAPAAIKQPRVSQITPHMLSVPAQPVQGRGMSRDRADSCSHHHLHCLTGGKG